MKKSLFGIKDFAFFTFLSVAFMYSLFLLSKEMLPHVHSQDEKISFLFFVMFFLFSIFFVVTETYLSRKASKWHFDRLNEEEKSRAKEIDKIITVQDLFDIRRDLERESREKSKQLKIAEQKKMLQG